MDYEAKSMYEGIAEDLGGQVGVDVDWFRWSTDYLEDNYATMVDDIYDVSNGSGEQTGRRWMLPFNMPVIMAQVIRSSNIMNQRGFYTSDNLRLVMNVGDVQRLIPQMLSAPNAHIKDRIIYKGQVYTPSRVLPRGSFGYRYAVVTIDCNQVNPEELVNDPQFKQYATASKAEPRNNV